LELILTYSKIAQQDLKEIYSFIRRGSIHYAREELRLIREAVKKLKIDPLLGKRFEKSDSEFTRELLFKNYRIVYDIDEKQINILSIHHHSRLISNNPAFKEEE
jgi:toxin ParE1/3/4